MINLSRNKIKILKKESAHLIRKRVLGFWKRKTPIGDKYPYQVHDSFEVLGEDSGYENFYLVGDSWLNNKNKPIVIVIGCNDWKFGFIANYLPDYRVAFSSRKTVGLKCVRLLFKIENSYKKIFIWGYNETTLLRWYLKNKIVCRIEDGFIRSSELGASHATPYSLVFDKKGLYYNPNESDILDLLNSDDYIHDREFLNAAKSKLETILDLEISKYNPPSASQHTSLGIKLKKRVAILGQVDADAAIKYGNPDNWSVEDIIKLAKYENPDAEIIYRPHPEIYKKYQKSKFKRKRIEFFAKISSPDEPLPEFFKTIDHVYVINSLTGLEALLRGIKVTTLGAAFYAGWGLSDDRCVIINRVRKLSILEIFAGVYIKYPKYLADLDNAGDGLLAACYKIKADHKIATYDLYKASGIEGSNILLSPYWVQEAFFDKNFLIENFNKIDFSIYLKGGATLFFQKIYLLSVFGLLSDNNHKMRFLANVRMYIDAQVYNEFLKLVYKFFNEELVVREVIWLLGQNYEIDIYEDLQKLVENKRSQYHTSKILKIEDRSPEKIVLNQLDIDNISKALNKELSSANYENVISLINVLSNIEASDVELMKSNIEKEIFQYYEFHMDRREFNKAKELVEIMLLFGLHTQSLLYRLVDYSKLRFDYESAIQLSQLNQNINLYANNRNLTLVEIMSYSSKDIQNIGHKFFISNLVRLVTLKPNSILSANFIVEKFKEGKDKDEIIRMLESTLYLNNEQSISKSQAFTAIGQSSKSITIIENLINTQDLSPNLICAYTQSLSFSNGLGLSKAIKQIEWALEKYINRSIYHEAIRLYILAGAYKKCLKILQTAKNNNIQIGEMQLRKTYFGNRLIRKALETFTLKKHLLKYTQNKYIANLNELDSLQNSSIFFVAVYGPGDEIRFASIYSDIRSNYGISNKLYISCSPKLFPILERSFPDVFFIPTERLRGFENMNLDNYSKVRGSDLIQLMDNRGADVLEESDNVVMVTDLLHKYLPDYESFSGISYLENDVEKTQFFKSVLPKNKKLIGISWRSSLSTHSRNEHYLSVEELAPLFDINGVVFVNFQYDDCEEELAWVEKKYPGKIIDIKEVDHYDDLDSVASLMKCMDLMISPATTVVELAGALGCPTLMLSNSSEIDWRVCDDKGTDAWHNSIEIISSNNDRDKAKLVLSLKDRLIDRIKTK